MRILDLAAPVSMFCSRILAGYGAEVVRLELPKSDGASEADSHTALLEAWYSAGCRSVELDFTSPVAIPILRELASTVDVVVVSPSECTPVAGFVPDPLGLEWCDESKVICFQTAFGATGPLRNWRLTPFTAHAMSGLMHTVGPEAGPPLAMPGRQHWDEAGVRAAICIAAAVRNRAAVGGQVLDISAHEVAAGQDDVIHRFDVAGLVMQRSGNYAVPPSGAWTVADGRIDIAVNTPGHWESFVKTMGSPADLTNEMWQNRETRIQLHDVLTELIEPLIRGRHCEELVAEGQANGLPCAALNTPEQFVDDQRRDSRAPLGRLTHPDFGTFDVPGPPIHAEPWFHAAELVAPRRGQHTAEVLAGERSDSRPSVASRSVRDLRVLTFGAFVAGNTAALILAELGMDVVKIESHIRPEVLRNKYFLDHPDVREPSGIPTTALYGGLARSVRSVAVELGQPGGAEVFLRLAATADVVVENFRPHVLEKFGCGFADLQAVNPRLTMLSISGYGRTGPRAHYAAYAPNISNHVGLTSAWGHSHGYHFDYVAAYNGALGVMAALAATERSGQGVHLDLAQVEAAGGVMMPVLIDYLATGAPYERRDNVVVGSMLAAVVPCAGRDRWLAVEAVDESDWAKLCGAIGHPTAPGVPTPRQVDEATAALRAWAGERTPHQAAHILQRARVPAAPVQNAEDLARDPQLRARGFIVEIDHRDLGRIEYPGAIERTVRPSGGVKGPVPRLGEHTRVVLEEWAGIDGVEAARFAERGSIWLP
jgi:crotonobetainyl-CoA:carnitine CoA-transferase CaiB-like acyl-CoA transferase